MLQKPHRSNSQVFQELLKCDYGFPFIPTSVGLKP